jgi:hypothetical protein
MLMLLLLCSDVCSKMRLMLTGGSNYGARPAIRDCVQSRLGERTYPPIYPTNIKLLAYISIIVYIIYLFPVIFGL